MTKKSKQILVVDDDHHVLDTLQAIIEEFDMTPITAENVSEALKILKEKSIDLIITDIVMPEIDGLQFIDIVKNSYPKIPIAVLSAYEIITNTVAALSKGAYNFVTKPFTMDEIKVVLEKGIRLRNLSLNTEALQECITNESKIDFPNDENLFAAVIYYVVKECQWRGIENDVILTNVSICLDEMLMNAYTHGNKKDKNKKITLSAYFKPRTFRLSVKDEGEGFDFHKFLDEMESVKSLSMKKKGIFILKTMVDSLSFNDIGNEMTVSFEY